MLGYTYPVLHFGGSSITCDVCLSLTFLLGTKMKNLLLALTAVLGLSFFGLVGCGGSSPSVVVPADEPEAGLSEQEQAAYEAEMMREQGN